MGKDISHIGDSSSHGGTIINSNQDGTLIIKGQPAVVEGAQHDCPILGHGTTTITSVITKVKHKGKLIITNDAVAGCGAVIISPSRGVQVS